MIHQEKSPPDQSLIVFSPFYPPSMGGLQNHAQEFNHHLAQAGYRITVFTPRLPANALSSEQESAQVRIIRFPAFELIPNFPVPKIWLPTFWRQWRTLKSIPAAVVVGRTRFFLTSLLAVFHARQMRRPYLHIEHGSDYVQLTNTGLRFVAKWYDHTIGQYVLRRATQVIANSAHSAAFVKKLASSVSPLVIYRGVETAKILRIAPDRGLRQSFPGKVIALYAGRLIAGKGIDTFVRALAALEENIQGIVVGDGPEYRHLRLLQKELKLSHQLKFFRQVSWETAIARLKSADIIVNPSYTEGLPTVIIEAALCQKAIIATAVGGTTEIIQHQKSGLLIPPGNVPALRTALQQLAGDPDLRQRLGLQAQRAVQQHFLWPIATAQYQRVITSLPRR